MGWDLIIYEVKRSGKLPFILSLTWFLFYLFSLEGGDLEYIKHILGKLGFCLATSVGVFTITQWIIAYKPSIPRGGRLTYVVLNGFLLALAYFIDHGVDFEAHGSFNFILFFILAIPLNIAVAVVVLLSKYISVKEWIVIVAFLSAIISYQLNVISKREQLGFFNAELKQCKSTSTGEHPCDTCNIPRAIPWLELLPQRAQTFWTGSPHCRRVDPSVNISLSQHGKLTINCPEKWNIKYSLMPITNDWNTEEKLTQPQGNTLQDNIIQYMQKHTFIYSGAPVDVGEAEGVVVTCESGGKQEKRMAFRIGTPKSLMHKPTNVTANYNVLIIFLDAIGRSQFFRRLPKTVDQIQTVHESNRTTLFQFFRYHVLGFNTDENTQALYTGFPHHKYDDGYFKTIWQDFGNDGFVTGSVYGHCEDWNTAYQGEARNDIDYELETLACLPEYEPVRWKDRGNFQGYTSITPRCVFGRHIHEWELDYSRKFIKKWNGKRPWFLLTSFLEGHEGTGEVIGQIDDALAEFLQSDVPWNNTFVFVVADHGPHMGLNFLFFSDGVTKHRSPILAIMVPSHFEQFKSGLLANEQKLVTAADVYATLQHLRTEQSNFLAFRSDASRRNQMSLFTPLPDRDCTQAFIPLDTCYCYNADKY